MECEIDILIIGAGPTGVGAALRLEDCEHQKYVLIDCNDQVGGLSRTEKTPEGFLFDLGGHITFSHYRYFDESLQRIFAEDDWISHRRVSHILYKDVLVPYPFQNNLGYLPPQDQETCLVGMVEAAVNRARQPVTPSSYQDWMDAYLGDGVVKLFLSPYSTKVWAISPSKMQCKWLGDRVPAPNVAQAIHSVVWEEKDETWGPNTRFRFPVRDGTGNIWSSFGKLIPESKKILGKDGEAVKVDLNSQTAHLADGRRIKYKTLVSTMPLTAFSNITGDKELKSYSDKLRSSSTHIVGIGLRGQPPERFLNKTYWIYFHEEKYIFNRVTLFSNYSPNNQPGFDTALPTIAYANGQKPDTSSQLQTGPYWSVLVEISESEDKPLPHQPIRERTVQGLLEAKILDEKTEIVSEFYQHLPYGYPTPTLERDEALESIMKHLEARNVYSRGRFGGWKYEVGNQDHSFMQGVEVVNKILHGGEETTFKYPDIANSGKFKA